MNKPATIEQIVMKELESLLERVRTTQGDQDYRLLKKLVDSHINLMALIEDKQTTIQRLRQMLFGASTEKTRDVIKKTEAEDKPESPQAADQEDSESHRQRPGHGRNGADAYRGAEKICVPHESLKSGAPCPECRKGKVYEMKVPGVLIRIVGQTPVQAKVYELQKLRCNLCGKVFTAQSPEGIGTKKYDATAASMIALLKYGSGLPFNRLEGLQRSLGIPLPASTQWDIVCDAAKIIEPVYEELIRQAAQGEVVHNDDTTMKILELMGKRAKAKALAEDAPERAKDAPKRKGEPLPRKGEPLPRKGEPLPRKGEPLPRKGVFTSGIVSTNAGRTIALFFTGRKHAGENLSKVLAHRAAALGPPIQMCDALSRNVPRELKTILGNCLAHGRRQFVDVAERFPEECGHLLEVLQDVYKNDAVAKERDLSPQERLQLHQTQSGPLMADLKVWLARQFEERLVEPNSALGEAVLYMLNHWEKLTLFLRQAGAPLDNNVCERALKKAILHRKNALFYKTENGARVGDLFMSLIYTCQLGGVDPFDYLTTLQRRAAGLAAQPENWMPWNYSEERRT